MKRKYKKFLVIGLTIIVGIFYLLFTCNCSSCERSMKSCSSDIGGGLDRIVNVYDYQGEKIATYEGQIDIQANNTKVLFDLDGKRYIYYNCLVEVIEK